MGTTIGVTKGDTRSLDYSSCGAYTSIQVLTRVPAKELFGGVWVTDNETETPIGPARFTEQSRNLVPACLATARPQHIGFRHNSWKSARFPGFGETSCR